ncbi:MAG: hypothetical protein M3442_19410 [Chloroflexota bacterium]|nr:hypothetical protein [Chloroflexota bacterium]
MAEGASRLTLSIDAEVQRQARRAAERAGLTLDAWIEQALRDALAAAAGTGVSEAGSPQVSAPFADAASATRDTRSSAG